MKIHHSVNGYVTDRTDATWAERVEREAEQHTARTEALWYKTKRRLDRAIEKAETTDSRTDVGPARKLKLWAVVEDRRQELKSLERLANRTPAGSQNRGKGSYRGVPRSESL